MEFRIECTNCESVATVKHELDHHFYTVKYCPFCGEEIESDMEDRIDDEHFTRKYDS